MKIIDKIANYKKEFVYDNYLNIVSKPKKYDKITRKEMIEEIINEYNNNPELIIDICTLEELDYLKTHLDDQIIINILDKNDDAKIIDSLRYKYLLIEDFTPKGIVITTSTEMLNAIKKALNLLNREEKEIQENTENLIIGLFNIYYYLEEEIIFNLYREYDNRFETKDELLKFIKNSKQLNNIIIKKKVKYADATVLTYFSHNDEFLELIYKQRENYDTKELDKLSIGIYSKEEAITIGKYGIDIENHMIKEFYKYIKQNIPFYVVNEIIENITTVAGLDLNIESAIKVNEIYINLYNLDKNKFIFLLEQAIANMPSWVLFGYNKLDYLAINSRKIKIGRNDKCPCGSGKKYKNCCLGKSSNIKQDNNHLEEKDCDLYYKIYFGLLTFVNDKYKINNLGNLIGRIGVNPNDIMPIREKLYSDNKIIDEFLKTNPFKFNEDELEIIKGFKKHVTSSFIILKHEKDGTIFVNIENSTYYKVSGIRGNIDEIIPSNRLPLNVNTTLIPFKNRIIYDSQLLEMNIQIMDGMKKIILEGYAENKDKVIEKL